MNHLVNITINDDGDAHEMAGKWHLVDPANRTGPATLCGGEFFGYGESGCVYQEKQVKRGGITCPLCLEALKIYKKVAL